VTSVRADDSTVSRLVSLECAPPPPPPPPETESERACTAVRAGNKYLKPVVSPLRFPFSLGSLNSRAGRVGVPRLRAA